MAESLRVVMVGGGSGTRDLTLALTRAGHSVTRVVPAWDSGGSSRVLRQALGMLAIGDIRHALMTLAHGEGRVGAVVRFRNVRLSEDGSPEALRQAFDFHADGVHPLLVAMAPRIRASVRDYLALFATAVGSDFDWRRGSIGNFVLAGAYLAHGRDINRAIRAFRVLCGIQGHVWPSTTQDNVAQCARLRDGQTVCGQDRITALPPALAQVGIDRVWLTQGGTEPTAVALNPPVAQALAAADCITWGPGSFFTSVLAHAGVDGFADACAQAPAGTPKVLVGNLLQCPETTGRNLLELVAALDSALPQVGLTHVLAHRGWVPMDRVVNGWHDLAEGPSSAPPRPRAGLHWVADDFEDPWARGRHDAPKLAATLSALASQERRSSPPPGWNQGRGIRNFSTASANRP